MKRFHKLAKYALTLVNNLSFKNEIKIKQEAFNIVRCRLEQERYIL